MSICQSVHRLLHEDPRRLTEPKDYEEESVQALEVYDETINALGEAPCANDDEFFITAANIVEAELEEYGEPNHSKDFHESVLFLCRYIAQRKARSQREEVGGDPPQCARVQARPAAALQVHDHTVGPGIAYSVNHSGKKAG